MQARRILLSRMVLGAVTVLSGAAIAWGFPSSATIVAPFPAGGPLDVLARLMNDRMRQSLGQPLVIENVDGAGGTVGVGRLARAAPDGHTALGWRVSHETT